MRFRIHHDSLYRYDVPVSLGEHLLRLTPRAGAVHLLSHRLDVDPEPLTLRNEFDELGNAVTRVSFIGTTQRLRVISEIELETLPLPALEPPTSRLPWPALTEPVGTPVAESVRSFADAIAKEAGHDPVGFLDELTNTLYTRFDRRVRHAGDARPAAETLELQEGACRDLTVLFLAACASQGIPGRFVSGYQAQAETPDGQRHLHAWAEVSLPGAGWRGWDAMHGLRVADGHVALCAAATQAATMPIEGGFSFQGSVVNSTLDHSVRISTGAQ